MIKYKFNFYLRFTKELIWINRIEFSSTLSHASKK